MPFLKAELVITPHFTICIYLNYLNFIKMILKFRTICFPPRSLGSKRLIDSVLLTFNVLYGVLF